MPAEAARPATRGYASELGEPIRGIGERILLRTRFQKAELLPLMHADEVRTNALAQWIIDCPFRVPLTRGPGFLEKVYEKARAHGRHQARLAVAQYKANTVYDSFREWL